MKYEYKVISLKKDIGEKSYEQFAVEQILDRESIDGWKLVTVDNGIAYFKRPIQENKK